MKICWDMLEGVRLTRSGTFRKNSVTYVYKESCAKCGEPYLIKNSRQSKFCTFSCAISGENNPMFGKTHTIESIKRMSKNNPDYTGFLNPNYKGGICKSGLAVYETYKDRLELYEDIRKQDNTNLLETVCVYCGQWFTPTYKSLNCRIDAINNLNHGEHRLYCSENCKQACPTYGQKKYPKGFKKATSREVSTYLRQMVMERDNWECQVCGKTTEETQLHCHHMDPVAQNLMFQNDMDSCITLCKDCHKEVHMQYGCRYIDLQCRKE